MTSSDAETQMNNRHIVISDHTLVDLLACPYKAYLKIIHQPPRPSEFLELQTQIQDEYSKQAQRFLRTKHCRIANLNNAVLTRSEIKQEYDLIFAASLKVDNCVSNPPVLQRIRNHDDPIPKYAPIRFVHGLRPTKIDRLLVSYDAFLLARLLNYPLGDAAIIYSSNFRRTAVRVSAHLTRLKQILTCLRNQEAILSEPAHILNRHCDTCEFQRHCWAKALDADHLSLLQGMSEAEIARHGEKGIFTVHQLSYTFRPRKPRKRAKHPSNPHHFSLQALALR